MSEIFKALSMADTTLAEQSSVRDASGRVRP